MRPRAKSLSLKALGKRAGPRDPFQDLLVFTITVGSLALWIICIGPFLISLLASHTTLRHSHPILYNLATMIISAMMVPWSFGLTFGYYYLRRRLTTENGAKSSRMK